MQSAAGFFFAFIAVLALIGLVTWLVRRFAGNRLGSGANRGRMPRLAIVDAAAVDGRRRLVLVRRDNIEHLLMIGGPSDIVIEPNIVRATPPQQQMPPRVPLPPATEQAWTDGEPMRSEPFEHDEPAPLPEPPPRPARPAFAEEMRRAPAPERRADPLAGFSPEPMARPEPPLREPSLREPALREPPSRAIPRAEPPPLSPRPLRPEPPKPAPPVRPVERAPAAMPPSSAADKNLAEMAQRLEAALRRPGANPAGAPDRAPPVAPDVPSSRTAQTRPPAPEPAASVEGENRPPDEAPKAPFKNLEDEMASLLGRPKTPS